jgi:hypothetical protein
VIFPRHINLSGAPTTSAIRKGIPQDTAPALSAPSSTTHKDSHCCRPRVEQSAIPHHRKSRHTARSHPSGIASTAARTRAPCRRKHYPDRERNASERTRKRKRSKGNMRGLSGRDCAAAACQKYVEGNRLGTQTEQKCENDQAPRRRVTTYIQYVQARCIAFPQRTLNNVD